MFEHLGMLTLKSGTTTAQRERLISGLRSLAGVVPGLRATQVATDAGIREGNADVFFRMTFDDRTAWEAYSNHPAHVAVAEEAIKPVLASKTFLQVDGSSEPS